MTEADIAPIFTAAYGRAAMLSNAISVFRKTGIQPFNPLIFTPDDFLASDVTDTPVPMPLANTSVRICDDTSSENANN